MGLRAMGAWLCLRALTELGLLHISARPLTMLALAAGLSALIGPNGCRPTSDWARWAVLALLCAAVCGLLVAHL